eukprot:PhF_6_TR40655/c0_g1_i1/m.61060/K01443/nagA, AMDHD2; N-acetylglucosamine-6-phosphate deacetylase
MAQSSKQHIALWGNVVTPESVLLGGYVIIDGDSIIDVCATLTPEMESSCTIYSDHRDCYILAGFVDIHNHGMVGGHDVIEHWLKPEENLKHFAMLGTTSVLASIIFSNQKSEVVDRVVASAEQAAGKVFPNCAILEGIHAEGPIIQDLGGLPPIRDPPLEEFVALCKSMPNMKVMTISPTKEATVGYARLRHLLEIGVRPSLGHDRQAGEDEILGALRVAAQYNVRLHSTHMYNVMAFHHTKVSLANFLLVPQYPAVRRFAKCVPPTVEMIADNIHVHPLAATTVFSTRNVDTDVCLISDCVVKYAPGTRVKYNGREAIVRAEGAAYLCTADGQPTKTLAGSTATLSEMLLLLCTQYRMSIVAASKTVSANPAKVANLPRVGSIERGKYANLVFVTPRLDMIERVMVRGQWANVPKSRILAASHSNL